MGPYCRSAHPPPTQWLQSQKTVPPPAWISPPVALSAYFLKGVVPEWDLKDIYLGMMQFMVIQVIGLVLIIAFPQIALWLPEVMYPSP